MEKKQLHKPNRLVTMLLLVMAILMPYEGAWAATNVTTSRPAQGDGSSSNPFQISNAKELAWFRDWVNGTYTVSGSESATTTSMRAPSSLPT